MAFVDVNKLSLKSRFNMFTRIGKLSKVFFADYKEFQQLHQPMPEPWKIPKKSLR